MAPEVSNARGQRAITHPERHHGRESRFRVRTAIRRAVEWKRRGIAVAHNTPRGLLKGSKVTRSHTTVIEAAIPAVNAAKESPGVSKIVIGVIKPTKTGQPHIKFTPIQAGLRMQVRGNSAVQIFFVYTDRPDDVMREITEKWEQR